MVVNDSVAFCIFIMLQHRRNIQRHFGFGLTVLYFCLRFSNSKVFCSVVMYRCCAAGIFISVFLFINYRIVFPHRADGEIAGVVAQIADDIIAPRLRRERGDRLSVKNDW